MGRKDNIILVVLIVACINAFFPIIPLPLLIGVIIATQLLVLNKYDNAFVLLILGTIIGAYFVQVGIRFIGVVAIFAGAVILWSDIKASFYILKGNFLFILFVLFYLFVSVQTTSGGNFATTKLITTIQTAFISIIAYTHLFLFSQRHNGRNLSLMFLIYSLFMIMVMNELYGTHFSLAEVMKFGAFREEYSAYRADEANTFAFNYQMIGMYACLGYSFYLLSYKKYPIGDNLFIWVIVALIVVYSTARQTMFILALITLLQLFITKQKPVVKALSVLFFVGTAIIWFSELGIDQQHFIKSDFEMSDNSTRTLLRISAINLFLDNPLFGVGYGRFVFGNEYGLNEHNIFVELLAELGLIGTLLLVIPLLIISFPFRKKNIPYSSYISFLSIITAYFAHFLVSSQFSEGIVLFVLIPLLRFTYKKNKLLCE